VNRFVPILAIAVVSMSVLAGCDKLKGSDGTAYISVSDEDPTYNGVLCSLDGLPTGFRLNTYYATDAGTHSGSYVLYYSTYSGGKYYTYFNTGYSLSSSSASTNISYYANTMYSSYHNDISYTITVNEGKLLFKDGADTYFDIYLAWSTANCTISSKAAAVKAATVEETSEKVVKELTDGSYTIRFEAQKQAATGEWKAITLE
jgi:hypothetical protein